MSGVRIPPSLLQKSPLMLVFTASKGFFYAPLVAAPSRGGSRMQSTWSSKPTLNGLPIIGSMIPKKLLKQCWPNLEEFRGYRKLVTTICSPTVRSTRFPSSRPKSVASWTISKLRSHAVTDWASGSRVEGAFHSRRNRLRFFKGVRV